MRTSILVATILAAAVAPAFARGGHGHRHAMHARRALSAPANPSVPPSLSPNGRTSEAPLPSRRKAPSADTPSPEKEKMDPEDAALDKRIKSICRGC